MLGIDIREMNELKSNYDLIRIHFDTHTESSVGYIVAATENRDGVEITSEYEFDVIDKENSGIPARIVDVCMKVAAANPGSSIEALVYPGAPRKSILAIGSQFGSVRFALRSELDRESAGGKLVTDAVAVWSLSHAPKPVEDNGVTFVATDGSLNKFFAGGSYGWISSYGEFGFGAVSTAESVLLCELLAIKEMLTSMKRKKNVRILVDNRLAIKISRDPDSMDHSKMVSARAKRIAREICEIVSKRENVEFRWVRGHSGHPLNEGADRLARNARLSQSFDQDTTTMKQIAKSIADDINEEYSGYVETIS